MSGPLIVIPTFNEVSNIATMIDAVMQAVSTASILVVDDASPDGTADLVETQASAYNEGRVQVLRRPSKSGLGTAYCTSTSWPRAMPHRKPSTSDF